MDNNNAYCTKVKNLDELNKLVGKELGISKWIEVTQDNINVFAKNLNDGSNEGISLWDSMAYSVQFHPESGPGTTDGLQIFNPFFEMLCPHPGPPLPPSFSLSLVLQSDIYV